MPDNAPMIWWERIQYMSYLDLFNGQDTEGTARKTDENPNESEDRSGASHTLLASPSFASRLPGSRSRHQDDSRYSPFWAMSYLMFKFKARHAHDRAAARREQRRRQLDKYFGFTPISRRSDPDLEASYIFGRALRHAGFGGGGDDLVKVWEDPTKAELRRIARLGKEDGWRLASALVATPRLGREEGLLLWGALEGIFRVPEECRVALETARGMRCFTEVPVAHLADVGMKARLEMRLASEGNTEQDGRVETGFMGSLRRPWGPVVACMPVIAEE
ncbi:uncharacterized protein DNG_07433 [Cephalotrichum gorgonifer]|uniref:Uncharacterized protein n=1 Tax=Cephalotrichum gorgonifer TaxID=2041049 RepID=A0AAE8N482_9PEZI|nr:uncharacterized protein DNG_07433 [Cephalotrichum gorgonifer]